MNDNLRMAHCHGFDIEDSLHNAVFLVNLFTHYTRRITDGIKGAYSYYTNCNTIDTDDVILFWFLIEFKINFISFSTD